MQYYFSLIFLMLLSSMSFFSYAQNGHYYLTHYAPSFVEFEEGKVQTAQDSDGFMYFSNRKGVLKYDGKNWKLLETPSSVFSLAYAEKQNLLLVGGRNSLGYIQKDIYGHDTYYSLSDEQIIGMVTKISIVKDKAYVLADGEIFTVSLKQKKIVGEYYEHIIQHSFVAMNMCYFIDDEQNFYSFQENQQAEKITLDLPDTLNIQFVADYDNKVIIGDSTGVWYQFDGLGVDTLKNQNKAWLQESHPHQIVSLDDSLSMVATEKGGAVIYNFNSGEIDFYLNYTTGLPDSEIKGIGKDRHGGIWMAHEYGFSRTNQHTPLRNYALYGGIEGNILSAIEFNGQLYVGTSQGLYTLSKIEDFKEIDTEVKVLKRRKSKAYLTYQAKEKARSKLSEKEIEIHQKQTAELKGELLKNFEKEEKKRRRKWRKEQRKKLRIAKKENKKLEVGQWKKEQEAQFEKEALARKEQLTKSTIASIDRASPTSEVKKPVRKYIYYYDVKKNKELILQSTKHKYKAIAEIEAKCKFLHQLDTFLVVGTNKGAVLLSPSGKIEWLTHTAVQAIHVSARTKELIIADDHGTIWAKRVTKNGKWQTMEGVHHTHFNNIHNIYIDQKNVLWLLSHEMIHRFSPQTEQQRIFVSSMSVNNPYGDDIGLWDRENHELHFVLHNGIYTYHEELRALEPQQTATTATHLDRFRVLQGHHGMVWKYLETGWKALLNGRDLSDEYRFHSLNRITQIRAILPSKDPSKLWVITKNNELFSYEYTKEQNDRQHYNLSLSTLKNMKGQKIPLNNLDFSYRDNNFLFSFVQPQYEATQKILYRYKLNKKAWSSWATESHIPFHLLNSGQYALTIESGNGKDAIYSSYELNFKIALPYWKETWFYVAEVFFFGFLLLLSFKLNQSKRVNVWIRKVLTYLTLIMLFAFLETVAQSYISLEPDPLLDFGVEACLALLLLPFENILKRLIAFTRSRSLTPKESVTELNNIKGVEK